MVNLLESRRPHKQTLRVVLCIASSTAELLQPKFSCSAGTRDVNRLRISEFTQNFWVFSFYIADFWQTFWVIWENGSNWSNLRLKMSFFALGRLKNHKVPHLHPNSTMFMPLDRLQLKIYAFSGKFNVCSKRLFLSWIKICRDFTLQTQIFTQKYRSWLRFYSEFLRKKLAVEASDAGTGPLLHLVFSPKECFQLSHKYLLHTKLLVLNQLVLNLQIELGRAPISSIIPNSK